MITDYASFQRSSNNQIEGIIPGGVQLVAFNDNAHGKMRPWYGVQLIADMLGDQGKMVNPKRVLPLNQRAILFSFLSGREYTSAFKALINANIPILSKDRGINHPIVIAGGQAVFNPEPIADLIDVFCIGDGEEFIQNLPKALSYDTRENRLAMLAELPGAYVPSLREFRYDDSGVFVTDMTGESRPIYPNETNQWLAPPDLPDRNELELARGCEGGCFFCTIAWIKKYRERPEQNAFEYLDGETATVAPNLGGVSYFETVVDKKAHGTVGDTRVDDYINLPIPHVGVYEGTQQLTFGIEGLTPRLRKFMGKPISNEKIDEAFERAIIGKARKIQLYFIRGVFTETIEDWREWWDWFEPRLLKLESHHIAVETQFTPLTRQAHTPLQWFAHPYNRDSERMAKLYLKKAQDRKKANLDSLWYVTISRREASWLLDIIAGCGSRKTLNFLWAIHTGKLGNLKQDYTIGSGSGAVKDLLFYTGHDPDIFNSAWDTEVVLPWSHIHVSQYDRMIKAHNAVSRMLRKGGGAEYL